MAMYPAISDQAEEFDKLMESYPEAMMKAFNIEELSFDTIERFLAMEQYSFVWPLMVMFLVISIAGSGIAKEIEKGTMEILLSRPVARWKIFFSRYLVGLFSLVLFAFCSIFSVIPFSEMHNVEYAMQNQVTMFILCILFGWAILSFAMMLSAMFSERGKVYMITGGMLVLMYVIQIVASLKESLENLKYVSVFYYFDASKAIVHNTIKEEAIWVFVGVIIVCTLAGVYWFNKRDVAV